MIRQTHLTGSPSDVAGYMAAVHEEKLTRSGETKAVGYYSSAGGAPSQWFGRGAERQGLTGPVAQADMERALSGVVAHTGEDLSTRGGQTAESRRMGEELTIAAPKSVSILAVEDPRIIAAHQAAAREAMAYVEREMAYARVGKGGGKGNDFAGNLTAGLYLHEDARDSESGRVAPHLHTHAVISNMIQRSDGTWANLKLDWGHNNEKKLAADAVYKSALAREIRNLGYQLEKGKGADFEIQGITREQIEYFSPRSADIKKEIGGERSEVSAKERQAAQNRTKGNKSTLNQIDQRYAWRREMREQNMDLSALRRSAEKRAASGIPAAAVTPEDALKSALRHLSERESVFSEQSLKTEALAAGLGDVSPEAIDAAIEARAGGLVFAGQGRGLKERQFTTRSAVFMEAEILQRGREGKGKAEPLVSLEEQKEAVKLDVVTLTEKELEDGKRRNGNQIHDPQEAGALTKNRLRSLSQLSLDAAGQRENPAVLPDHAGADRPRSEDLRRPGDCARVVQIIEEREKHQGFRFSDGQKSAVALALTSQDRHIGIVGAAGAGKTTAMACIVEQYRLAGYEVIGVAPSAAAANELKSAGCETRTLASALVQKPEENGEKKQKRLYVMDESGMVSAKDMDAFLKKADRENARSILVGDPLQLQSVEAGCAYKQLLESGSVEHVRIDEIQRQKDPQLREIAQAFAGGDAARGAELARPYMQEVRVGAGESRADRLADAAAAAYMALSPEERSETLLLAGTNATRQKINEKIREGLAAEGTLGGKGVTITALDKMDMTKEEAAGAESYADPKGGRVVLQFDSDFREKGEKAIAAERGSQWDVIGTEGGKLQLRSREDPGKMLEIRPGRAKVTAYLPREMELRDGDQVLFRQNDNAHGVVNGMAGTVRVSEKGVVMVQTAAGQQVPLPASRAHVVDYSYARTVHSSQGATVERAIVVGEASRVATAESAYVACSREKTGLQIITDDAEKLGKSWEKFSERQSALQTARERFVSGGLGEIQQARAQAAEMLGRVGDLAEKREEQQMEQLWHEMYPNKCFILRHGWNQFISEITKIKYHSAANQLAIQTKTTI